MECCKAIVNYKLEYKRATILCVTVFGAVLFILTTSFCLYDFPHRSGFEKVRGPIKHFFNCSAAVTTMVSYITFLRYVFKRLDMLNSFLRFESFSEIS